MTKPSRKTLSAAPIDTPRETNWTVWNGTRLRLLKQPGGGTNTVSCPSTSFCMALTGRAAEIWNGTTWRTAAALRG
jgi:hypothetical protein